MSEAFEKLALPVLDDLYHAALSFTRNEHDARDLVQECYLRALRGLSSFREGTNFRAWMYTILRNVHLDQCRRRKIEPVTLKGEEASPVALPPPARSVEDLSGGLRRALDRLSPSHRLLLFLCDVEGFSYREISDILGCPMGSVMSGLFHARQNLRRHLEKEP